MKRRLIGVALIAVVVTAVFASWRFTRPTIVAGPFGDMEFSFLGCAGDWPPDLPNRAIVIDEKVAEGASFLVRDPVDCGVRVKDPRYTVAGKSLALSYTTYVDGPVAACSCDYRSRFKFKVAPGSLGSITFGHKDQ